MSITTVMYYLSSLSFLSIFAWHLTAVSASEALQGTNVYSIVLTGSSAHNPSLTLETTHDQQVTAQLLSEVGALTVSTRTQTLIEISEKDFIVQSQYFDGDALVVAQELIYDSSGTNSAGDKKQYLLAHEEVYTKDVEMASGWTNNEISQCGGIRMLGGYGKFAGGEVRKTFGPLPPHQRLRITANYHFIDGWVGESGFMRGDAATENEFEYLWTEKYDHGIAESGINVCGQNTPEGRLTSTIDVEFAHTRSTLTLTFGSTLQDDPYSKSFGVSNIQIYFM